jgi:hypothetical protein
MRLAGIIGALMIVFGVVVLAKGGLSYVTDRDTANLGIVKVTAEQKDYIPPWGGGLSVVVGLGLVFAARGRRPV